MCGARAAMCGVQKRRLTLQPCRVRGPATNAKATEMEENRASLGFTPFTLPAIDGHPLGASLFEPRGPARGTLIVHGATATPQRFYRGFARHLAEGGVRVVTYDYRGVGESRPASLRGYRATMTEWARLDARAMHRHVGGYFGAGPVAVLGHSFGGQLVGLIDEPRDVAAALFVGAQLGYYGHWPPLQRARLAVVWRALVPAFNATLGYLPGRAGIGEDLPRGVAEEWARWCTHPEYLVSEHPDAVARFGRFDRPAAFYSFTDDEYGPPGASARCSPSSPRPRSTTVVSTRRSSPRGPSDTLASSGPGSASPSGRGARLLDRRLRGPPSPARPPAGRADEPRAPAFAFDLRGGRPRQSA